MGAVYSKVEPKKKPKTRQQERREEARMIALYLNSGHWKQATDPMTAFENLDNSDEERQEAHEKKETA